MDRPLKRHAHSDNPRNNVVEALQALAELATITRKSLETSNATASASPTNAAATPQPLPPDPTQFTTSNNEYAPALQDPELLQALLGWHAKDAT